MGERNNFARMSRDVRRRVMYLLVNGATQDEVREDPEVAAEIARKRLALHSTTFQAIERCPEFAKYQSSLDETEKRVAADRWAADALRDCAGITSVADLAQMQLLQQLREFAEHSVGDPGDLLKLVSAVTKIKAADQDDRIVRANRKVEELKSEFAQRESEYQAKIAELSARVAELAAGGKSAGLTPETLKAIEEKMKIL